MIYTRHVMYHTSYVYIASVFSFLRQNSNRLKKRCWPIPYSYKDGPDKVFQSMGYDENQSVESVQYVLWL